MSAARSTLLVCLVFSTTLTLSQTARPIQTSEDRLQTRLELARGYLVAAGLHVPGEFDVEHLPELRAELRAWLDRQTAFPATGSTADIPVPPPADVNAARVDANNLINDLHLTKRERVLRLWQYKAEAQEQPKTVVVGGNQELNPDHVLWRHSLIFKFSELSLSSADLASIYDSYGTYAKPNGSNGKTSDADNDKYRLDLNQNSDCLTKDARSGTDPTGRNAIEKKLIPCLRRVRPQDFFWRGMDGLTATVSMGQNPRFQQSALLGPGQAEHLYSGEIDFDPTYLFPNGSDWSNVAKVLGAFKQDAWKGKLGKPCPKADLDDCFNALLFPKSPTLRYKVLSAVIPTFTFKEQTQFDFIKNIGGEFLPPAFPEPHLWYVSFTTDLRRAVNVLKSKTDALAYLKVLEDNATKPPHSECAISLPAATVGTLFFYSLDSNDTSRTWKFTDGTCKKTRETPYRSECMVNGIAVKKDGTLVGYPHEPGDIQLDVEVSDKNLCKVTLKILPAPSAAIANKFVLDYLELAISHEVLLDDQWFGQFRDTAAAVLFSPAPRSPSRQ
jgi:hypothetical protein